LSGFHSRANSPEKALEKKGSHHPKYSECASRLGRPAKTKGLMVDVVDVHVHIFHVDCHLLLFISHVYPMWPPMLSPNFPA
jgi:hypothetical protein